MLLPENTIFRYHLDDGIEVFHGCHEMDNALTSYSCNRDIDFDSGYLTKCLYDSFNGTGSCRGKLLTNHVFHSIGN